MNRVFKSTCIALAGTALANKDAHMDFELMAQENGYASEHYTIVSEDGYAT